MSKVPDKDWINYRSSFSISRATVQKTHISKLQKIFSEMNDEMNRLTSKTMPDLLLMSRVLSTLPPEYFEFKSLWESVPMEDRTIDKLIERLRLIEMRLPSRSSETAALLTKRKEKLRKEQQNSFKSFESKSPGHLAGKCRKKSGRNHDQEEDWRSSKGFETGELHGIALVCESHIPELESWIADTACCQHMTYSKKFYHSYQPFDKPIDTRVGNEDVIRAHGKGNINVEMLVDGRWQSNYLTEVWYVPELGRNLLSAEKTFFS
ncbi:hypothetical protein GE061_000354 [Apolygus lucorum]|uniref:Retrovirus-related Pol polyprotein from transposon TNT 1-94-like beta-barrel domain-containing protein n=1 Tax=Apolygus lucorum TaxID=248454 RepID=A0A8S9Y446_APOLU|nr:hypothetical protein GE061_000354 [Apolygus lucorum]